VRSSSQERLARVLMSGTGQSRRQDHGYIHTVVAERTPVLLVRCNEGNPHS
jgi:hypothetical protein